MVVDGTVLIYPVPHCLFFADTHIVVEPNSCPLDAGKVLYDEMAYSEANELTIQFLKELGYVEEAEILENIGFFYG